MEATENVRGAVSSLELVVLMISIPPGRATSSHYRASYTSAIHPRMFDRMYQ
jgi:hypothetical protein